MRESSLYSPLRDVHEDVLEVGLHLAEFEDLESKADQVSQHGTGGLLITRHFELHLRTGFVDVLNMGRLQKLFEQQRVLERIESERRPSFWDAFLEPSFGRRLLATSLMLVCLLGGYVVFTEAASEGPATTPEAVMVAEHPPGLGSNVDRDRETVLVSLATYRDYR